MHVLLASLGRALVLGVILTPATPPEQWKLEKGRGKKKTNAASMILSASILQKQFGG